MKSDERNIEEILQRSLPSAPSGQMESALARVFTRLQSVRGEAAEPAVLNVEPRSSMKFHWRLALVGAAAAVALLSTALVRQWISTDRERVLEIGETVRADAGGSTTFALADGSKIEMRSQSELSLERADDGVRIRLTSGGIIVNAAKQPSGHLYVQTKDMTVSVVGTVFLVNAERDGSRVAVIEGEVRVHEGTTETKLRPGEQVSTSPNLAARPVKEEIAWSRQAGAHLALLQQSAPQGLAQDQSVTATAGTSQTQPQFEEASIRPCDPENLPQAAAGGRGGGMNSFNMTPGRTHASCMTAATLIRTAYGYGPADLDFLPGDNALSLNTVYGLGIEDGVRVRGGPSWVFSDRYSIDAIAGDATDAETMRGPMLRELLERRFQLKAHIEAEQIPAFALTVAKGGLKIKPVDADACTPRPRVTPGVRPPPARSFDDVRRGEKPSCGLFGQRNGPNRVFVGGGTSLPELATLLAAGLDGVQVLDKTGITETFNILLEFAPDENTRNRFLAPPSAEPSAVPRDQSIFAALEEQLGLKLEPARTPREFIVIDRIERPSPN